MSRFTKTGLVFDNGSTLDVDAVIFATGYEPSVFKTIVSLKSLFFILLDTNVQMITTDLSLGMNW